ncbi:MAG: hypothetical protein ACC662_10060, partial [Planctomycetota bacterium]
MSRASLPLRIEGRADLEALLARTTNYEEKRPRVRERPSFRLERVRHLLAAVGDPQEAIPPVHLAGSKGKGSTARMVEAALRRGGLGPVGLFTSPHLEDLAERIAVDGVPAPEEEIARAADHLLPYVRRTLDGPDAPSFFEIL